MARDREPGWGCRYSEGVECSGEGTLPVVVELATTPSAPITGDTVRWDLSVVNQGDAPVRVPAELLDKTVVNVQLREPNVGYGHLAVGISSTSASSIAWVTLAPGEKLDRAGVVCARCVPGLWAVTAAVPKWTFPDAAADQVVPASPDDVVLTVTSPAVAVYEGLTGSAKARTSAGGADVDVRLTNTSKEPLWVPKPENWASFCTAEVVFADGSARGEGLTANVDGWEPLHEDGEVLLKPGRSLDLTHHCDVDLTGAVSAKVTVSLSTVVGFVPLRPTDALRYFAGGLDVRTDVTLPARLTP